MRRKPRQAVVHGVRVTIDHEWPAWIRNEIYRNEYEADEVRALRRTLRADDRVLEIGAGLGVTTTVASQRVGGDRVIAFEADPALVPVAAGTARANGFDLEINNAVLGNDDAPQDF